MMAVCIRMDKAIPHVVCCGGGLASQVRIHWNNPTGRCIRGDGGGILTWGIVIGLSGCGRVSVCDNAARFSYSWSFEKLSNKIKINRELTYGKLVSKSSWMAWCSQFQMQGDTLRRYFQSNFGLRWSWEFEFFQIWDQDRRRALKMTIQFVYAVPTAAHRCMVWDS